MALKLRNGEKIIFTGDSITDRGCREAQYAPLGFGYPKLFRDLLLSREPKKNIEVLNRGWSGHTIQELWMRWEDDILSNKPDWLSIMIGINDIHRYLENGREETSPEKYAERFDEILTVTKKRLPKCKILLIEPFYMSRNVKADNFRRTIMKRLPEYIKTVRAMAKKHNTRLLKMSDLFAKLLKDRLPNDFGVEPVHPNDAGHLFMAEEVYKALSR